MKPWCSLNNDNKIPGILHDKELIIFSQDQMADSLSAKTKQYQAISASATVTDIEST